jgi:hypothetical protein
MRKETAEILGAFSAGILDGVLEGVYLAKAGELAGKFPYVGIEQLPPGDDWLVLGASAAAFLLGRAAKRENVKAFGKGMLLYSAPMIAKVTTQRWIVLSAPAATAALSCWR